MKKIILTMLLVLSFSIPTYAIEQSDSYLINGSIDEYDYLTINDFQQAYDYFGIDNSSYTYYFYCTFSTGAKHWYSVLGYGQDSVDETFMYYDEKLQLKLGKYADGKAEDYGEFSYMHGNNSRYHDRIGFYYVYSNYCITNKNTYPNLTVETNLKLFLSLEDAQNYLESGDVGLVLNPSDSLEDFDPPQNVSMYEASNEGGAYLYWECNDKCTYTNLSFEFGFLQSGIYTPMYDYLEEGQENPFDYSYDYEPVTSQNQYFVEYPEYFETAKVELGKPVILIHMTNWYNVGERWIYSDTILVKFDYNYGEPQYSTIIVGDTNNDTDLPIPLPDNGIKNEDYDGNPESITNNNISTGGNSGSYSFLDFLFNGFGLLGNNGLLSFLTDSMAFVPEEIWMCIGSGISAMIIVGLIKLVFR